MAKSAKFSSERSGRSITASSADAGRRDRKVRSEGLVGTCVEGMVLWGVEVEG